MKNFNDLVFEKHSTGDGLMAKMFFPNGYGVSIVRFKLPFESSYRNGYGSYTSNEKEWELAVLRGDESKWDLTYDTGITSDVMGYLSNEEVSDVMSKIQSLK